MEVPAFAAIIDPKIDYKEDWIIDSGCSNHMTNDDKKLEDMTDYKGGREVLIADNFKIGYFSCWKDNHSKVWSSSTPTQQSISCPRVEEKSSISLSVDRRRKIYSLWTGRCVYIQKSKGNCHTNFGRKEETISLCPLC
jgi:hypothetical protein